MTETWRGHVPRLEDLARTLGLDWSPVIFEAVPDSFMTEIAVYGLPVRMPHWSFGARYIYQLVQRHMGFSRLFEVVFPGNPGHAYLAASNGLADNILVTAHVLGHADFSKNNMLFRRCQEQISDHIVEHAANHARQIERHIEAYGQAAVERVLDAALSLEQYIDLDQPLRRERYPEFVATPKLRVDDEFHSRFAALDVGVGAAPQAHKKRAPVPAHPERDLLWFIATYAPELESWERDIFLAVREESFYFYPVFATQIMNEGWASYWHARLLRESDFIPQEAYVDAIKCHSDVVRPIAAGEKSALAVNPYHLGFTLWEEIVKRAGIDEALRIRREDDDFSFLRNHLTREIATDMGLFSYQKQQNGQVKVVGGEIEALREGLLSDKYNFGAPRVSVVEMRSDGTLILEHDTKLDGRGLDVERAGKVLQYVKSVWRRPVLLKTLDASSQPVELSADPAAAA
ncbi:MAG TPA: SpoVR family protein [Steroidobacteraceae bacterium]|jgi:stage V sporulation protein R|nr:SpoVR family protein [Steroidobacteraceae bacterium]